MNWIKSFWIGLTTAPPSETPGFMECYDSFTPRAQQVLGLARKEAERFCHNFVGTEHVLLGLIGLGQGVAVNVLHHLGLDLEVVRKEVEKQLGIGPEQKIIGTIPYTPRVRKVLALAVKEAKALNHSYVGTEHILLGLLREGDGLAARLLKNLDVDIEQTRQEILKELDPNLASTNVSAARVMDAISSSPEPKREPLDVTRRYDVYCREQNQEVIYRNALLKGIKTLFEKDGFDAFSEFVELEQENGQTIFVAKASITKFHEAGTEGGKEAS